MGLAGLIIFTIATLIFTALTTDVQGSDDHFETFIKERKLREGGYEDFEFVHFYVKDENNRVKRFSNDHFRRRKRAIGDEVDLSFSAFGENYHLRLRHTTSVLHPEATIIITNGEDEQIWNGDHPDCFLTGEVASHENGTASLSYCNKVIGGIKTDDHLLHIEDAPAHINKSDANGQRQNIIVAKKVRQKLWNGLKNDEVFNLPYNKETLLMSQSSKRHKRAIVSTDITVELAIYTDELYTKLMSNLNMTEKIQAMLVKYNGVQMEWSRVDQLGFNVTFVIKLMNIFETNPPSYDNTGNLLGTRLSSFCAIKSEHPYDLFYMHVGAQGLDVSGRAYLGSLCKKTVNCGVDNIYHMTAYVGTAHEIGHNFGMNHDDTNGCVAPDVGCMGGYAAGWSTCSKADMTNYFTNNDVACLWEENIPTANVSSDLQGKTLSKKLIGQEYSPDEACSIRYGSGYRFRKYPLLTVCQYHSCVNYNAGPTFGIMTKETIPIPGMYCESGKICFKSSCATWEYAKQYNVIIQTGGWGEWGSMSSCSRTCGYGMQFRKRVCDNPIPINTEGCIGSEFDSTPCNKNPCLNDSNVETELITQRATEVCAAFITNNVLNSTLYKSTGIRYSGTADGQCEVKCDKQPSYTSQPSFTRFGLMPDGTPCTGSLDPRDTNDYPRRPGYYYRCLQGFCLRFGCDDKVEGNTNDACGVCGGDNSTCTVVSGYDSDPLPKGERRLLAELPIGSYNILFTFDYMAMKSHFVEVYDNSSTPIIAPYILWVFQTLDNPISFAGTMWHYDFSKQHLYAKGPITEPAIIKLHNAKDFTNAGVSFWYSLATPCSGTCDNGGIFNTTLCACDCTDNFYGVNCSMICNKTCQNGGIFNMTNCSCLCNANSYGNSCENCKYPYKGENCQTCKHTSCDNCGTFNSSTCRCECLDGYGGLQCQSICADTAATCASDVAAGKCQSDNKNTEPVCMASCGTCNATTMAPCNGSTLTTTVAQVEQCASGRYTCRNGDCIELNARCDGSFNCTDKSDEENCNAAGGITFSLLLLTLSLWTVFSTTDHSMGLR